MRWIVDEVDELVASGVLTPEGGTALRGHYAAKLENEESGGRVVLLSVLGATLIGAGVILLIAHNWDDLGRPVRTVLSLLPLLVSLAISFWTVLRKFASTAWRESAGVAQSAGVAASIALVSQTYHISGELSDFMFIWMILTLPIPYVLRAAMPALVYLAGIAVWAGTATSGTSHSHAYWLLLAGILPFCVAVIKQDRLGNVTAWLTSVLGISAAFGLGFSMHDSHGMMWALAFIGYWGVLYLTGALVFPERRLQPMRVLGGLGVAVLTIVFSFKGFWSDHFLWRGSWAGSPWPTLALTVGFPCASGLLLAWTLRRKADFNVSLAATPLVAAVAFSLQQWDQNAATGILIAIGFNLFALGLALYTAFRGIHQRSLATLNGGLLVLAALIISRFVDSDFSTIARGLAFVGLGCVILGANFWMLKTKKEVRP